MSSRPPTWRQLLDAATAKTPRLSCSQPPLPCDSQPALPCASQPAPALRCPAPRSAPLRKLASTPASSTLGLTQPQETSRNTEAGPSVVQFLTQQPTARDAVPAEASSRGNSAAEYSQHRQEDPLCSGVPEAQCQESLACTQGALDTQATQAVPSTGDLTSAARDDGLGVLPITLQHYGTLYSELVGNDGAGCVKACSGLEENKYSKTDLKQASTDHPIPWPYTHCLV